jgi:hypothetical protein
MSNVGRLVAVPSPESQIKMAASAAQSTWREDPTEPARSVNDNRHPIEEFWRGWAGWLVAVASLPKTIACCGVGLAALLLVGMFWHHSSVAAVAAMNKPLPTALEPRAVLMAEAWLSKDLPGMLRLTESAHDRELRRWLASAKPPQIGRAAAKTPSKIEVVAVNKLPDNLTEVTLAVAAADQAPSDLKLPMKQVWLNRKGQWYFLPGVAPPKRR